MLGLSFGGSASSSADSRQDKSLNLEDSKDNNLVSSNFDLGKTKLGGTGNTNNLSFEITDKDSIEKSFNTANLALNSAAEISSEGFDAVKRSAESSYNLVERVNSDSLDFSQRVNSDSLDFSQRVNSDALDYSNELFESGLSSYSVVTDSSNNLISKALVTLSDTVKNAFNYSETAQQSAIRAISETTGDQSALFSKSLAAVQSGVSSNLTQGNTDIIKFVMTGLAAFGLVFALFARK